MDENLKYYTIGEVQKITGVSAHTLRYYDKIDIFKASYVNEETGYRYYDSNQFWKLEIIKLCKNMEFSLEELKETMSFKEDEKFVEIIQNHRLEVEKLVEKYTQMLKDIDWFVKEHNEIKKAEKIKNNILLKEMKTRKIIYKKNVRSYKEFHLTLQAISRDETSSRQSIQRHYGHFFDIDQFKKGFFHREGEFLDFGDEEYKNIEDKYIFELPEGTYVTMITNVRGDNKGIRKLLRYLKENNMIPKLAIGIEVGLPLFDALGDLYCEIQILI